MSIAKCPKCQSVADFGVSVFERDTICFCGKCNNSFTPTDEEIRASFADQQTASAYGTPNKTPAPLEIQVGGNHYKDMAIQPVEFIHQNNIGFIAGNVIKYVCRHEKKNGIEDLKKARHYIDLLIDQEARKNG